MAASTESAQVYLSVVADYRVDALKGAVRRFIRGEVPDHNGRFVPSTAELARVVRDIDWKLREDELFKLYGPSTWIDFGSGRVELRGLTGGEKDLIVKFSGRSPSGRNLAYLPLEEIRVSLKALTAPKAAPQIESATRAKIQRMSE